MRVFKVWKGESMVNKTKITPMFFIIGVSFITCLLISNIISGKLFNIFGFTLTSAVIIFPITYILGDVITEIYGFKLSRLIIWTGFICNIFMAIVFSIVVKLPYPDFWNAQQSYGLVLSSTPRTTLASLLAYFLGTYLNSVVLSKLKVITNGKWLWTRTIGSTVIGEGVDSFVFISIVFWDQVPFDVLVQMILVQYGWKVVYEIALTPLTYIIIGWLKRKEGIDTFDHDTQYNPFSLKV